MIPAFWLLAGAMVILALAFIALPVWSNRRRDDIDRDQLNTKVVREQLTELKADRDSGKLDASTFEAARHDLERELLDALDHQSDGTADNTHNGRWLLLLLVPAIPLIAIMLYQQLGAGVLPEQAPQARAEQAQGSNGMPSEHDINRVLEQLVERLKKDPNHPDGWMLLGRSYTSLHRYDDAVSAYEQARKYGGDSPELLIDYADTLIAASGGDFSDKAGNMLKQAMTQQPDNPKGLWLIGHWYYQHGDYRKALNNWQRVAGLVQPGSENARILQQQIKLASARLGEAPPPEPAPATGKATDKASIRVSVSLDPTLTSKAAPDDTVFIFARAVSGPRMPLAIVLKQVRDLPVTVTLDDSLAMSPAMVLSRFPQVAIGARISKTGQAMPAPGDLQGMQSPVQTHKTDSMIKIVINSQVGG